MNDSSEQKSRSGVQAFAAFASTVALQGTFFPFPRRVITPGFTRFRNIAGPSFECRYEPALAELEKGEPFVLLGIGTFRFRRELRRGGDAFGATIIELMPA